MHRQTNKKTLMSAIALASLSVITGSAQARPSRCGFMQAMTIDNAIMVPANTPWQETICYSRAVRVGSFIAVSQTSAVDAHGNIAGGSDPYAQAIHALRNVETA